MAPRQPVHIPKSSTPESVDRYRRLVVLERRWLEHVDKIRTELRAIACTAGGTVSRDVPEELHDWFFDLRRDKQNVGAAPLRFFHALAYRAVGGAITTDEALELGEQVLKQLREGLYRLVLGAPAPGPVAEPSELPVCTPGIRRHFTKPVRAQDATVSRKRA